MFCPAEWTRSGFETIRFEIIWVGHGRATTMAERGENRTARFRPPGITPTPGCCASTPSRSLGRSDKWDSGEAKLICQWQMKIAPWNENPRVNPRYYAGPVHDCEEVQIADDRSNYVTWLKQQNHLRLVDFFPSLLVFSNRVLGASEHVTCINYSST